MTLIEFLGFIITMILVIYLSSKRAIEDRKRRLDPNYSEEDEEQDSVQQMVRLLNLSPEDAQALEKEIKGEPQSPPPPPQAIRQRMERQKKKKVSRTLSDQYALRTNIEDFKQHSNVAERKFDTNVEHRYEKPRQSLVSQGLQDNPHMDAYAHKTEGQSRVNKLLNKLDSKKDMVILYEILDRPKALKDGKIHW
jgi:hypothetical protein